MKALILSDIHSNIYALEAVWAQEQDSDMILCTGDLVDYGPFPCEVLDWVREHEVICTQGNHDLWVAMGYRSGLFPWTVPPEQREWRHHNAGLLSEEDITLLEQLPTAVTIVLDGVAYGMTHLYTDYDVITSVHAYQAFAEKTFDAPAELTRIIFGHTHRQGIHYLRDDLLWLNPGSVSYRRPDDPDQSAHYATITDGRVALKQVHYDLTPVYRAVEQEQLKEEELRAARWFFGPRER